MYQLLRTFLVLLSGLDPSVHAVFISIDGPCSEGAPW
jgi:hypothetical protein